MQADGHNIEPVTPFSRRADDSASDPDPQLLTLKPQKIEIPDHELLCLIGRGAYGEVWMARNAIGTLRAVKLVHRPSFKREEDFEREFKGLLKFEPISRTHDGLVDILQIGRRDDAGYFFYVMELADAAANPNDEGRNLEENPSSNSEETTVSGHLGASDLPRTSVIFRHFSLYVPLTLRSELQVRGCLAPDQCVAIGLKLATALEHLHANGLVHRDIKPSNIIFVAGEPKLADIGLVTAIDEAHSLVGTVGYIPPEGPGTPQADLYSLGKVLYEIAFGKDRQEFPQLPSDLQSHPDYVALLELNEIILRACEGDPRNRYHSAAEMKADLVLLQHGQSVKQARTRERRWDIAKRLSVAGTAVALLVTALIFLKGFKLEHSPNAEAWREYELGRHYYNQLTPEAHKKAIEHLNLAVKADPKYVKPYGELIAICVWGRPGVFGSEEEKQRTAKEIADKLLALDPRLAEGHTALSWWKSQQRDWRGAEDEIVHAIKLNPNYSIARDIYAFYLSMLGRADEAQRQAERSQELDPTARTSGMVAAWPFMAARQFDKAIAQLQRVVELDKNFPEAHNFLGTCYEAQSNYVAAIEEWRIFDTLSGNNAARVNASYAALRQAYDSFGEQGYFRKYIELIRADESLPESERIFHEAELAGCYARLGDKDKALDALENQFDHRLKFDSVYDSLHDEPRFKALLTRAGLEQ